MDSGIGGDVDSEIADPSQQVVDALSPKHELWYPTLFHRLPLTLHRDETGEISHARRR